VDPSREAERGVRQGRNRIRPRHRLRHRLPLRTTDPARPAAGGQIKLLVERIADAEEATRRESERHSKELQDVRAEVDAHTERLARADEDIKQLALALSLGTARLQITGLVLVGIGTLFMAVPTLLGL